MRILYTIGFTKKTAQEFFGILNEANIDIVVDVRFNNTGQLAGFTKKNDLKFFLTLVEIEYEHWTQFAPTKEIRKKFQADSNWEEYERSYRNLIEQSCALDELDTSFFSGKRVCLLCSESTPENCHRRIAAEMIADRIGDIEIIHL